MINTLIIVESPNKIKKVKEYCGSGYEIMATYGTIYTMKDINLIINNNFSPRYELLKDKLRTNNNKKLKDMCKKASNVIIATDNDREGEHIAYQVCRMCSLSVDTTPRMRFSEISESAIKHALHNTGYINKGMVYAAQTRQIIDLIIGFTISPILWKNIVTDHTGGTLSAGRCQTPTLRLIYDSFKGETDHMPYEYCMVGYFTKYHIPFQCITPLPEEWNGGWKANIEKGDDGFSWKCDNYFLDSCRNHEYEIEIEEPRLLCDNPPLPLNTSKIQQLSPFSAKNTMTFLYQLYEMGHITYIRTEVKKYSRSFIEQVSGYITNEFGEDYVNNDIMTVLSNDISDSDTTAHEAIRPTDIFMTPTKLSKKVSTKELNVLYSIIHKHTLESCSTPMKSFHITCNIQNIVSPDVPPLQFRYTTSQIHFYGWKIFTKSHVIHVEENTQYNYLTSLRYSTTNKVKCHKLKIYPKAISGHNSYYTESKLINKLEMLGIGRPSTYASLTDKLFERKYITNKQSNGVEMILPYYELNYTEPESVITETNETYFFCEEKNKLNIEPLGVEVIEFLLDHFGNLFDYEYTKRMENILDDIINTPNVTNKIIQQVCSEYYDNVMKNVNSMAITPIRKLDDKKRSKSEGDIETNKTTRCLGMINMNTSLFIKKGRYGTYAEWTNETGEVNRLSVSNIVGNRPLENISITEIEPVISSVDKHDVDVNKRNGFVRTVTKNVSVYYGKYGHYIHFKSPVMKKAKLYNLNGFGENVVTCNVVTLKKWISEKYNIF
jgi:DNA topoisomerase-1